MKLRLLLVVFAILLCHDIACAGQSTILFAEGYACMGDDKSRKQTEQMALTDAKRNAVENAKTYIKAETHVSNFQVEKDIIAAYAVAEVIVKETVEKAWYKDASMGDCFRIKIKADVIPDEKKMMAAVSNESSASLYVEAWTDKKEYRQGEAISIKIRGNKPFFARVIYKDVAGDMIQLLPNPYRKDNYFNGNTIYEIPSGKDEFKITVNPPFGEENIIVYASTSQLGDLNLEASGSVYLVKTKPEDVEARTRSVKLEKSSTGNVSAAEIFQKTVSVKTGR